MESSIPVGDPKEGKWVTVSLGVSTLVPDRMVRPYQVFERAVLAMRLAKNRGGNKVSGDRPVGGQDDEGETKRGPVKLYAVSPRSGKGQGQGQGQGE